MVLLTKDVAADDGAVGTAHSFQGLLNLAHPHHSFDPQAWLSGSEFAPMCSECALYPIKHHDPHDVSLRETLEIC